MSDKVDLKTLQMGDMQKRVGENFGVDVGNATVTLELTQVRPLGDSGRPGGAFSLWFVSPPGPFLPQGTYALRHPDMGDLEIFIVPLGPRPAGNLYESIFT